MPAAGYAIDLLPGRGLRRERSPRSDRAEPRHGVATPSVAFVRALRHRAPARGPRSSWASAGTRRCPALVGGAAPADPGRRARADAHPGLANRIAVRLGARAAVSLPGTPLPRRGGHRQPDPARDRRGASGRRSTPAARGRGRRQPRRAARSTTPTLDLYDRWRDRADVVDPPRDAVPRDYEECRDAARGARRARATRSATGSSATRSTWRRCTREATLVVCRAGRHDAPSSPRSGCRRCSCRCPARPATTRPRNAEALVGGGRGGAGARRRARRRPPRRASSTRCSPTRRGCAAMSDAARALGRARRRRPVRRPGRGGGPWPR